MHGNEDILEIRQIKELVGMKEPAIRGATSTKPALTRAGTMMTQREVMVMAVTTSMAVMTTVAVMTSISMVLMTKAAVMGCTVAKMSDRGGRLRKI